MSRNDPYMKWPEELTLIRHAESAYNELKKRKEADEDYQKFKEIFKLDPFGRGTVKLANTLQKRFALKESDAQTPLTPAGIQQAIATGAKMKEINRPLPDIVLVSPYLRTLLTHQFICLGWPELKEVKVIEEDRVREQEHGLSLLYSDWRIFHTLHPEQKKLYDLLGPYWYQYPQGESVSQVKERLRSIVTTIIREFAGKRVMIITHHLAILAIRANLERLSDKEFIRLDQNDKPVNCGITTYIGDPKVGANGHLELKRYNEKLY